MGPVGKTVVVLGGGIGGVVAATELRRRLSRDHRVVLIDRTGTHAFQPSFLWVMSGAREPAAVVRDLAGLRRKGVELKRAEVRAVDLGAREVETSSGKVAYDYLVMSLGAELDPGAFPGLAEAGLTFYTLEGAAALRSRMATFQGGRVAVLVSKLPFKCPAAPYEAALILEAIVPDRGLRDRVEVEFYTPEKLPMPVAGPAVGAALKQMLESRGIRFHPEHALKSVDAAGRRLAFGNGVEAPFDLLAFVPPHRAPACLRDAGLLNEAGWVPVDPRTLETAHPGVFAIGDLAAIKLESGLMLPKAGVFAHAEAKVVAANIAAMVEGRPSTAAFDGHGQCWVEAGGGKAAFAKGDFYASPSPAVALRKPSALWHLTKVLFERYWLLRWFRGLSVARPRTP